MLKEKFKLLISNDEYLVERKDVSHFEKTMYLRETNFKCPICGKDLLNRKQKKSNSLFEIAHIYPNKPTQEQYETLQGLERLGQNCESFENKIALCLNCHRTQDFHTTKEEYLKLLNIKKLLLQSTALNDITIGLNLEAEIKDVLYKLSTLSEEELCSLNYSPVKIANKLLPNEHLLKNKITIFVTRYYPFIREVMNSLNGRNNFSFEALCLQIRTAFIKMSNVSNNKEEIYNQLVNWVYTKTGLISQNACEVIIAFFVQNCEVFDEITE